MELSFSFSDLITGYVEKFDWEKRSFTIQTSDARSFDVKLTDNTGAEVLRNLGEPYVDCTGQMADMLANGRFVFVYGIHYPEAGKSFEAKHLVFVGRTETQFRFEDQDWWIRQVRQLGDFYLRAQFPDDVIDYRNYRTDLTLYGKRTDDYRTDDFRQETDTISRLVYGFASAYLMTGDDRYLEAAEAGTKYLHDHFRSTDGTSDICYWYHAIDVKGKTERKILASRFGDDWDAVPAYEQIYALAGPVQTYRITGDPVILDDARRTQELFHRFYDDTKLGGYFSHIDPIGFDPRAEVLTFDRARKNWNSVGDHAPAYLINLFLATGAKQDADMLAYCADMIVEHFPDYDHSAFVQEKFHEDWSPDRSWGWQQNRAVVGHNLKIAWNLTRIAALKPDERYTAMATKIAKLMPKHGMDAQRGGWYDVVERKLAPGETIHRYAWHDRKAWWQQEQAILAYLIMAGVDKDPEYLKYARESAAFYNAWFLDQDSGGVYFNVLANGLPYLLGTERQKGSHSMSGYHSFELCYLAAVYSNLLVNKQPMDFFFKPKPGAFPGNLLRIAPDLLPPGSIRIESVEINGQPYDKFDADGLTVTLPTADRAVRVKVKIVPTSGMDKFSSKVTVDGTNATLVLQGEVGARALTELRAAADAVLAADPDTLVIDVSKVSKISSEGARLLAFLRQKLKLNEQTVIKGANQAVRELLVAENIAEEVTFSD
jgi:mannose/cellobiose epimerase-like protein (N-acyl-D-glucosamine 2-epimerase family)/ABC-type transporter Mla MlaB component